MKTIRSKKLTRIWKILFKEELVHTSNRLNCENGTKQRQQDLWIVGQTILHLKMPLSRAYVSSPAFFFKSRAKHLKRKTIWKNWWEELIYWAMKRLMSFNLRSTQCVHHINIPKRIGELSEKFWEVLRQISEKVVMKVVKENTKKATGCSQLYAGQETGCEAVIQAMREIFESNEK